MPRSSTTVRAGEANVIAQFVTILDWFLKPENSEHWAAVQKLAVQDSSDSFATLKKYVLEANRFSGFLALIRICFPDRGESAQVKTDQGSMATLGKGEVVLCNVVSRSSQCQVLMHFKANVFCLTDSSIPGSIRLP